MGPAVKVIPLTGPLSVDKHLKVVREAVWEIRADWRYLAMELGINMGTLKVTY